MSLKVAWLPAHPSEGSESMLRYWRALQRWTEPEAAGIRVIEALGKPPEDARRASRWRRFWCKRVLYPLRVKALPAADVYHLLDHSFGHLCPWLPASACLVATVHDVVPLDSDEGLTPAQVDRFRRSVAGLARATTVVVPSAYTAGRVTDRLGIPRSRIAVLPMGVDLETFRPKPPSRTAPYVLSVGGCSPRKNLALLPAAMARAAMALPGLTLVRVGEALPGPLRRELDGVLGGRVVERGRVDEAALADCYAGALALLLPSKIEGFGLPVLEAMACGCPVVASRATSLPEAGGEAAWYFEPDDAAAAAAHLVALATQPQHRAERVARGGARARRYSWSAHAAGLISIYREAAAIQRGR